MRLSMIQLNLKKTFLILHIIAFGFFSTFNLFSDEIINNSTNLIYALQTQYRLVAEKVLPSVVEINVVEVIRQQVNPSFSSPWDLFGDAWPFQQAPENKEAPQEREFRQQGLGSGVIIRERGNTHYIITNNHVVGNADEISIKLYDGREFDAEIIGTDGRTDLALISFESDDNIPVLRLGDSDRLNVGDFVFAVGNPLGFESSVTQGIVSALGRKAQEGSQIANFTDYIQTDAAINPGNSGGALVNLDGDLIGINTWIASNTGGSDGLGFAIPVNNAKKAINDFIEKGEIIYGWLGVSISDITGINNETLAEDLKISNKSGSLVLNVYTDSPAFKGGLLPGDFIIKVDNTGIENSNQLTNYIGNIDPGTTKRFTVLRYGREENLTIKLDARDTEQKIQENNNLWPGMIVNSLSQDIREQIEIPDNIKGIIIGAVIPGTASDTAGLKAGDVITKVNNKRVDSVLDFYKEFNSDENDEVPFRVYRDGREILIGLVR